MGRYPLWGLGEELSVPCRKEEASYIILHTVLYLVDSLERSK
jgi:hypothetical protein